MSSSVAEAIAKFDVFLQLYVGISVQRTTRYSRTVRRRAKRRSRAVAVRCGDGNREPRGASEKGNANDTQPDFRCDGSTTPVTPQAGSRQFKPVLSRSLIRIYLR